MDWCAIVYEHANYKGWQELIPTGKKTLANNDGLSSVKVKPGCAIDLYKHIDLNGNFVEVVKTLVADEDFAEGYNDEVSGVVCSCD